METDPTPDVEPDELSDADEVETDDPGFRIYACRFCPLAFHDQSNRDDHEDVAHSLHLGVR